MLRLLCCVTWGGNALKGAPAPTLLPPQGMTNLLVCLLRLLCVLRLLCCSQAGWARLQRHAVLPATGAHAGSQREGWAEAIGRCVGNRLVSLTFASAIREGRDACGWLVGAKGCKGVCTLRLRWAVVALSAARKGGKRRPEAGGQWKAVERGNATPTLYGNTTTSHHLPHPPHPPHPPHTHTQFRSRA